MRPRRRHSLLYTLYLRSPLWRLRRRLWILHACGRCQQCGCRRRLTIHHRTYRRLGHERRRDIEVLCWRCHQARSRPAALRRPVTGARALRSLAGLALALVGIHTMLIAVHAL
jgi:5-methylcytosine-specific restriction endonuclease McrA